MEMRKHRASGFTLVEVLIALMILAFGMLAMTMGQLASLKTVRQSRSNTTAMYLAQQQMETFHMMPGADVVALITAPGYPADPANPIDPDPADDNTVTFNRRWFVTDDSPEPGLISLRVEVDWVDPLGFTRTTTLESVKVDL